jgi:hypothetical protein
MSIASNVIDTNTNLASARSKLITLLENHGIVYYNTDDIFTLARRVWFLIYPLNGSKMTSYSSEGSVGKPIDFKIYMVADNEANLPDGSVADFFISIDGADEIHIIGKTENGVASCQYTPQQTGTLTVRGMANDWCSTTADINITPYQE